MLLLGPVLRSRWCTTVPLTGVNVGGAAARHALYRSAHVTQGSEDASSGDVSLLLAYQRLLEHRALLPDARQATAVRSLQLLQDAVVQREQARLDAAAAEPASGCSTGRRNESSDSCYAQPTREPPASQPAPGPEGRLAVRGAYLWGPVGSGKTALMDHFATTTRQRLLTELPPSSVSPLPPTRTPSPQAPRGAGPVAAPSAVVEAASTAPHAIAAAPLRRQDVVRRHFHEFMQGVHGRLHQLQEALPRVVARSRQGMLVYRYAEPEEDPLLTVAREWGSLTAVLCLDELHVTDVADAMILSRLFGSLMVDFDTAVLFTSNRPPRDLYKGGLSRKYFEPFVRLVDEQMVVLRVAAEVDYRRAAGGPGAEAAATEVVGPEGGSQVSGGGTWFVGKSAEERLRGLWQRQVTAAAAGGGAGVSGADGSSGGGGGSSSAAAGAGPVEVPAAYGRTLKVPCAAGDAALLTFSQLCGATGLRAAVDDGGALAAPDFLALSRRFREIYVTGVPQLGPAQRDEARRLVTLLDVAYDNRCRLAVAAAVTPDALFAPLLAEARRQGANPRLGLPKSSRVVLTDAPTAGTGSASTAAAAPHPPAPSNAPESASVPAASVTAALHMRLGPSLTHGSAATNTIHPSEFTGSAAPAAAFAIPAAAPQAGGTAAPSPDLQSTLAPPHSEGQEQQQQGQRQLRPGSSPQQLQPGDLAVPPAVLAEEVLMYHRAASRLAEMCRVVQVEEGEGARR